MQLLPHASLVCVSLAVLVGCSSTPAPDAALEQQVTRALARATDPSLSPADSRDRSTETLAAAAAALNFRDMVSADNVLNVNTTAYKKRVVVQADSLTTSVRLDPAQGAMLSTDRQLDVAIQGQGFFRVRLSAEPGKATADGTAYGRCGMLYLDKNGDLCVGTDNGARLLPPITMPAGAVGVEITQDGNVLATLPGEIAPTRLGRIELTTFADAGMLTPIDGGFYVESKASGSPVSGFPSEDGVGVLQQGYLEASNVDFTKEMLLISRIGREYELIQKAMMKHR